MSDPGSIVVSRRRFLGAGAGSAALLAAGGFGGLVAGSALAAQGPVTRYPLYVPPTVAPTAFSLRAATGTVDLGGGKLADAWVYNGLLPGPTLQVRRGDRATITLRNALAQETITHWHGMVVDHENDGHPMMAVGPGGTYAYDFVVDQRAALNWYHPHTHMLTGQQVAMGLAGGFVVRDPVEDGLGLPAGLPYEVPLILRDASLDKAGDLQYTPKSGGFTGSLFLVNGTRQPYLDVDTAVYRFRILAGSNARIWGLTLSDGSSFRLIGNDGGLLESRVNVARIDLSPGERADVLVDLRTRTVGSTVTLRDARTGWNLLELRVARSVSIPFTMPTTLSTITPLGTPARTRTFSFDGMSKINGREYDMGRTDFSVPFGEVERWRFVTNGNAPHPVHVHGASFQVESRTGGRGRLYPWERGWKDTVLLNDQETVDVIVRFDAHRGLYLMHCHKLEHEDMGMMVNFEVV